jgi:hypothetical protein
MNEPMGRKGGRNEGGKEFKIFFFTLIQIQTRIKV